MSTLAEIEAAVDQMPPAQQKALFASLAARLRRATFSGQSSPHTAHSVLEIPVANVGKMLRPLSPDDDLLGEMLEGRA